MVWLAKWLLENQPDARVLLITGRTELDEEIEGVFKVLMRTYTAPPTVRTCLACSTRACPG